MKRVPSLLLILLAYAAAVAAAWAVVRILPGGFLIRGLAADLMATLIVFAFSMIYGNSSTYDPYWSVAPPFLLLYWAIAYGTLREPRTLLVLGVTLLWSVRLTSNWIRDWPGLSHEDWRYREFRERFPRIWPLVSFGGIHLFPTLMTGLACIPGWAVISSPGQSADWRDLPGLLTALGGTVLCYAADEQMRRHRQKSQGVMIRGLWAVSRHPNYLGELMFWFGLWFLAMSHSSANWRTGAGAIAMLLMFCKVSIPWMERRMLGKYPEYAEVMKNIPALLPRLRRKSG